MSSPPETKDIRNRQVRAVAELLISDGWEFVRMSSSRHPILRWTVSDVADAGAKSGQLVLTSTPSDHRSLRNCLSDARRISGVDHARLLHGAARPKHLPKL